LEKKKYRSLPGRGKEETLSGKMGRNYVQSPLEDLDKGDVKTTYEGTKLQRKGIGGQNALGKLVVP